MKYRNILIIYACKVMLSSRYLSGGWLLVITHLPVCLAIFLTYKLCVYNARFNSNTNLYYVNCVVVALEFHKNVIFRQANFFLNKCKLVIKKGEQIFKKFQVTRKA